jgi:ATP-binding cassette, subfamily B, multidrug efflux pump
MVIVLWIGGARSCGAHHGGDFVAFTFYLNLLTWPLIALGWVVNLFQRGEASMGRLNAILHTRPTIEPGVGGPPGSREGPRGHRVPGGGVPLPGHRAPRAPGPLLPGRAGETVAIVGPTGPARARSCRSSPAPRSHRGSDPPRRRSPRGARPRHPARKPWAWSPRTPSSSPTPSRPTWGWASPADGGGGPREPGWRPEPSDPRVRAAAEVAQFHEQVEAFPRGYGTPAGGAGDQPVGGQKQRATLARALARDPMILILDDALSAVDTHTEPASWRGSGRPWPGARPSSSRTGSAR